MGTEGDSHPNPHQIVKVVPVKQFTRAVKFNMALLLLFLYVTSLYTLYGVPKDFNKTETETELS